MPRNFIRSILFDFGGTLMYGRRKWEPVIGKADDALAASLREQGLEVHPHTFSIEFRKNLDTYFKQREKDLLETTYSFVLRELLSAKGYDDVSDTIIRKALDSLFAVTQENWTLEEDAVPALKSLKEKGYNLGIVSNAGDDRDVQQLARGFKINDYFDFILTSAACSYRKPHPRIFEIALANWYALPNETVMIGDNLDADISGAKNAGLFTIWIHRRADKNLQPDKRFAPDVSIESLSELPATLDRIQI